MNLSRNKIQHLGCLLDLPLLDVELAQLLVPAAFRAKDLQLGLLDLDVEDLDLVAPVLQAPVPSAFGQIKRAVVVGDVGDRVADPSDGLE